MPTGLRDQIPIGIYLFSLTNGLFSACAKTIGFVASRLIAWSFEAATSFVSLGGDDRSTGTFGSGDGRECRSRSPSTLQRNGLKMSMVVGQSLDEAKPFGFGRGKHVTANPQFQGNAEQRARCSVPAALRAPAPPEQKRWPP